MLLREEHTRLSGKTWIDPRDTREEDPQVQQARSERNAFLVFKRRITSLKAEKMQGQLELEELRSSIRGRMQQSRDEGFEAGRLAGRKEADEQLVGVFSLLGEMEQAFQRQMEHFHQGAEKNLVELAGWMAAQVLAHELPLDSERLERQLKEMLIHYADQSVLRFHLHPRDRETLHASSVTETMAKSFKGRLEWVASADVPTGSCRLELPSGIVDGAPVEMLQHLVASLENRPLDRDDES